MGNFGWVYPGDSGEYVCRASNLYGSDETRAIIKCSGKTGIIYESQLPKGMMSIEKIREMESGWQRAPDLIEQETEKFKPCFVTKPEAVTTSEGGSARFCCRVTGYPKPRVMWLINGHTVINGSRHKLIYDGMWHLDIPKCQDRDNGKIEVIARNQCGEAYATTTLSVKRRKDDYRSVLKHNVKRDYINSKEYRKPDWLIKMEEIKERLAATEQAPKFIREIKEARIKDGMRARFEAGFAGNPKPEISWYFKGQQLQDTSNIQIKVREDSTTLTILECSMEMAGYYECKAVSDLGQDKTRASLTINQSTEEEKKSFKEMKTQPARVENREETRVEKKEEKKVVKKVEEKKEAKVYDWKKSVKKKEESKPGVQLKPIPAKAAKEEEKKDPIKLKPIPAKVKPEEEKLTANRADTSRLVASNDLAKKNQDSKKMRKSESSETKLTLDNTETKKKQDIESDEKLNKIESEEVSKPEQAEATTIHEADKLQNTSEHISDILHSEQSIAVNDKTLKESIISKKQEKVIEPKPTSTESQQKVPESQQTKAEKMPAAKKETKLTSKQETKPADEKIKPEQENKTKPLVTQRETKPKSVKEEDNTKVKPKQEHKQLKSESTDMKVDKEDVKSKPEEKIASSEKTNREQKLSSKNKEDEMKPLNEKRKVDEEELEVTIEDDKSLKKSETIEKRVEDQPYEPMVTSPIEKQAADTRSGHERQDNKKNDKASKEKRTKAVNKSQEISTERIDSQTPISKEPIEKRNTEAVVEPVIEESKTTKSKLKAPEDFSEKMETKTLTQNKEVGNEAYHIASEQKNEMEKTEKKEKQELKKSTSTDNMGVPV